MSIFADAAVKYHSLGFHPIPCKPWAKEPLVKWEEFEGKQPDLNQVIEWWDKWPDANVALVLGRGMMVVDMDGPNALELLSRHKIILPESPLVKTGKGHHAYFQTHGKTKSVNKLFSENGNQVDIKADGGYVLAPPSIHPSGAFYSWIKELSFPLPMAPERLIQALLKGIEKNERNKAGWVEKALSGVTEGERNDTCAKLAGFFLGHGLNESVVFSLLKETFAKKCNPAFEDKELWTTIKSIGKKETIVDPGDVAVHVSVALEKMLEQIKKGRQGVVQTPFSGVNKFLSGGFSPGELIYLGARPGIGKTAFGLEIARETAKNGKNVLFVSREMVVVALARRMCSQEGKINASILKRGNLDEGQLEYLRTVIQKLVSLPIWLTDQTTKVSEVVDLMSVDTLPKFDLLIVDYLQLLRAHKNISEKRLQIESISQGLKSLAIEKNIPVLCLSSLSRPVEGKSKKPALASLRESGELEHDADVVMFLHREAFAQETECIIAKNREGRCGITKLLFTGEYLLFDEALEEAEETPF